MEVRRYFLHGHPWTARSWDLDSMRALLEDARVMNVQTHMCQFGMRSHIGKGGGNLEPVKKPIGFASNSWAIVRELDRLCKDGSHVHVALMSGLAAGAQVYVG